MRAPLAIALLLAFALLPPTASAAPCTWHQVYAAGIDVDACVSDESGRPTIVMVKHKDVGGAAVSDTESDVLGGKWRFTDVMAWTYWRTPVVGQSSTYVGFWCLDWDAQGSNCDWFAAGASAQAAGTGAGVFVRNTAYDGWALCIGNVANCLPLPGPEDDVPYLPYLA